MPQNKDDDVVFEVVTEIDFIAATKTAKKSKHDTADRTHTGWYRLPHTIHGFCTVPKHEEVQQIMNPEQREFRDRYPTRMLFQIGDYQVCKDCYIMGADLVDLVDLK